MLRTHALCFEGAVKRYFFHMSQHSQHSPPPTRKGGGPFLVSANYSTVAVFLVKLQVGCLCLKLRGQLKSIKVDVH